jgi:hypothetical protein
VWYEGEVEEVITHDDGSADSCMVRFGHRSEGEVTEIEASEENIIPREYFRQLRPGDASHKRGREDMGPAVGEEDDDDEGEVRGLGRQRLFGESACMRVGSAWEGRVQAGVSQMSRSKVETGVCTVWV